MTTPDLVARPEIAGARRVVVKVGSSSLTTATGGLDPQRLTELAAALAARHDAGQQVVLVSSGAIASGLAPLHLPRRPRDLPTQQAAASVGQGILLSRYAQAFADRGITTGQVLLTADDLMRRSHYRNAAHTFAKLLDFGVLPIVNENDTVATHEIRFGDNDRLAALVAHVVHADALVLLSDVEGLYDGPPSADGTVLLSDVRDADDLSGVAVGGTGSEIGSGGMATKVQAAQLATTAGIPVVLTQAALAAEALAGAQVGTLFHPRTERSRSSRRLWLAYATEPHGSITVDAGAVAALTDRRASLLPAGITGVEGEFVAGDPIDLRGPDGTLFARGLVAFDAAELPGLLGRSTKDLAREKGPEYEREVVHADDLVLLSTDGER